MPNFKADIDFDLVHKYFNGEYSCDIQTEFGFMSKEENGISLVHANIHNKSFFIQLKKQQNHYLIKLDKHSKIDDLAVLTLALHDFSKAFCKNIISSTLGFNKPKLSSNVVGIQELLTKIKQYKKVILEIGFGSARQLLHQAKTNDSDTLIVGLEIYKPSILQASKLLKEYENVVLLNDDARFVIDILPKGCIDLLLLHFPVPWNDSKTRRVISEEFFKNLSYVLKENAMFWLRTDDDEYFEDAKALLKDFKIDVRINEKADIVSKYEDRWLRLEKNIYDIYATNTKDVFKEEISMSLDGIVAKKIKSCKIVGDDYFLNIEKDYEIKYFNQTSDIWRLLPPKSVMLKISYGSFTKPFHAYILNDRFLFNKPYFCTQNIKALSELKKILGDSSCNHQ